MLTFTFRCRAYCATSLIVVIVLFIAASSLSAQQWNNPLGGEFHAPLNWNGGAPGPAADALFDLPNTYSVNFGASAESRSLTVKSGNVSLTGVAITYEIGALHNQSHGVKVGVDNGDTATLRLEKPYMTILNHGHAVIGDASGATGEVSLQGWEAIWVNQGHFAIGESGIGTVAVTQGASVMVAGGTGVGNNAGSLGQLLVDGPQSSWYANGAVSAGYYDGGQGSILVSGGALFTARHVTTIAQFEGSQGDVIITGSGSTWTSGHYIEVGAGGRGSLTVSGGGTLVNQYAASIGISGEGDVLVTGKDSRWINNGDLRVGWGKSSLNIADSGTVFNRSAYIAGDDAHVLVSGAGSIWNASGSIYIGEHDYHGLVSVADGGKVISNHILIGQYGTLAGTGTIEAPISNFGGVISPGNSAGLLHVAGDIQQFAGVMAIQIGGLAAGTEYDLLDVSGDVYLGGNLKVDLFDGFVPSPGDTFQFLTAKNISGSFGSLHLPTVPGGHWVYEQTPKTLSLTFVVPEPSTAVLVLPGILVVAFCRLRRRRVG